MKTNINNTPKSPRRSMASKISKALSVCGLAGLLSAGSAQAVLNITIDNSGQQFFAVDPARHFLYSGEAVGPGGTKHLNVINTLTDTVVGNYNFTGGGYSSYIAASGTNVFWADQGDSLVRMIGVSNAGIPTQLRLDSMTLATGVGALSTTYAASLQGTGDVMKIVNISTGVVQSTVSLGGVAGPVYSDTLSNLYYVRSTNSTKVIDLSGNILRTLSGLITTIDFSAAHHYVYSTGLNGQVVTQLSGGTDVATGKAYDFGAATSGVTADALTGNLWVSVQSQNRVVELDSAMNFLQQFTVASPAAIAVQDGQVFVDQLGTNNITIIAAPEPATFGLLGLGALLLAARRRRNA